MIPGCFAFLLIFLGDLNDLYWEKPLLRLLFPVGSFLLALSVILEITQSLPLRLPWLLFPAFVFLLLLIYTLFFALSADEAYVKQEKGRQVCASGMYSFCRHPGVWWLWGMCLCLYGAGGISLPSTLAYCLLDLLLAAFEDRKVFPAVLDGYPEYCNKVPFLIPRFHRS